MSLLHEPGDLARTPVAALLVEALNLGATGVLAVKHGGAESRVFLKDGVPVGAQTFAAFNPLGQVLLAARRIDMDTLARSLAEMARTGRPQGEVLVEMGAVTRADVDHALSEQQAGYLALVAGVDAGTYAFEDRQPPEWTRTIRIAPLRAIVQALEQPQAVALVASAVDPARPPVRLAAGTVRLAEPFGWSADEVAFVERLEALSDFAELERDPAVPAERARAIMAALLLLGLAQAPGAAEFAATPAVRELADLAGEPLEMDLALEPEEQPVAPAAAARPPPRVPSPEDDAAARERRQRLLARAMENLGVAPRPGRPAAAAAPPAAAPPAAAAASRGDAAAGPPAAHAELRAAVAAALQRARTPDLFARLGIPSGASREEVRNAYFRLAKRFHPDRFGAPELADLLPAVQDLLASLNAAYDTLSDERRRAEYVARGAAPGGDPAAARLDFLKAEACFRTRDLRRARTFYEAAVKGDPTAEHLAALAWALYSDATAPDRPRARQLVTQALRDPRCARALFVAGSIARAEGLDVAAERHFKAVVALDPAHADAQRELKTLDAKKARRDRPRD